MKYWVLLIGLLAYTDALVHYMKLTKGANGCKVNNTEIAVYDTVQDPQVCGVYHCQNKEGDALILYCQIPPYFVECPQSAIDTTIQFPDCCWTCVMFKHCENTNYDTYHFEKKKKFPPDI